MLIKLAFGITMMTSAVIGLALTAYTAFIWWSAILSPITGALS